MTQTEFLAARLRVICGMLDLKDAVPEDDDHLMECAGTILGMVRRHIEYLQNDAKQLADAVLAAHLGYIPGSDGAPCDCQDCVTARKVLESA